MWEKDTRLNSRGLEKQKQPILDDEGTFPGQTKQKPRQGIVDNGMAVAKQPPMCKNVQ